MREGPQSSRKTEEVLSNYQGRLWASRHYPLLFESKQDAAKYKNILQSVANEDWAENKHYHKMYGDSKPKWKVEEYNGNLFI